MTRRRDLRAGAHLYRAVDCDGNAIDCRPGPKHDVAAAKVLLRKTVGSKGRALTSIALDVYAASHRAVRELPGENPVWCNTKRRLEVVEMLHVATFERKQHRSREQVI